MFYCETDKKISFVRWWKSWHKVNSSFSSRIDSGDESGFGFEEMWLFLAAQLYQVAGLSNSSTRTQNHFRFVWNWIRNWKSGFWKFADLYFQINFLNKTWKYDYDKESRKWAVSHIRFDERLALNHGLKSWISESYLSGMISGQSDTGIKASIHQSDSAFCIKLAWFLYHKKKWSYQFHTAYVCIDVVNWTRCDRLRYLI